MSSSQQKGAIHRNFMVLKLAYVKVKTPFPPFINQLKKYIKEVKINPVQEVADSCKSGAAKNVIFGLALGYKSVIIPIFAIAASIYVSFNLAAMYGIADAALGMLSTIASGLAIDAYGPISDNVGGIAEMAGMSHSIRERIDALDAAGNTTAAIGKILKIEVTSQDASLEDAKDYYYFAMEVMQTLIS